MILSAWEAHYRKITKPQTHKLMSTKDVTVSMSYEFWQVLLGEEQLGC
jgi:hypothetical protein